VQFYLTLGVTLVLFVLEINQLLACHWKYQLLKLPVWAGLWVRISSKFYVFNEKLFLDYSALTFDKVQDILLFLLT